MSKYVSNIGVVVERVWDIDNRRQDTQVVSNRDEHVTGCCSCVVSINGYKSIAVYYLTYIKHNKVKYLIHNIGENYSILSLFDVIEYT